MAMPPLLFALFLHAAAQGQAAPFVNGTILDSSGAPVPDATVRLEMSGALIDEFRTASDGRFEFTIDNAGNARDMVIRVTAAGFAQAVEGVSTSGRSMQIALQPAPFFEAVNVTSSRADVPRADPTVTMTVFSSLELSASAAVSLDDALKMVPGFTLFRRTSSRVSNPTAQGITLRGLGGTGSSRSLVLADGVPLNDAFGGWVYWDKVPQAAIDRVEVERGSGSDLYGADAVGGVVQILTQHPGRATARALLEGGVLGTGRVSLFGAGHAHGWNYSGAGEWFKTDGYITVAEDARQSAGIKGAGPIDTRAGSMHRSGLASVGYQAANGWHVEARGSVFTEDRQNGTPAVINRTAARQGSGELSGGLGRGLLSARVYGARLRSNVLGSLARSDDRRSQPPPARPNTVCWDGSAVGPSVRAPYRARRCRSEVHQGRHSGNPVERGQCAGRFG
jgi:outer membrane receptor protein involved in Fe transport